MDTVISVIVCVVALIGWCAFCYQFPVLGAILSILDIFSS